MNTDSDTLKPDTSKEDKQPTGFMKWLPLLVMSLALTIIILDTTILNVTLRTIVGDLHTTLQKIQWVITAYSLMLAAFTITGGRLGDLFGRKKMFVTGAIIFAVGSFMTSISKTVGFMIAGEAIIEGIGACLMLPATLSLLRSNYKGRDLQTAFGIWGGIVAGAAALGPVIGGWFTTHYTWRWAFRVNVFVAAILVIASIFIKEYKDKKEKPTIDFVGVLLSALGMLSTVFGFIQASVFGWWKVLSPLIVLGHTISFGSLSATPIFIALGILILGLFFFWESHMEKAGRTPLVSIKLFKNKTFMTGSGVSAILALGQAGLSFSVPVYLQTVLKLDPLHTGLAMIPMTAVILISAPLSAWMSKYVTPKRIIQFGIVLDAIGFIVLRQSLHVGASQWAMAPGFALFGLGLGFMMAQSSTLTLSAVSIEQSGEASGVNNTLRSLGQTLGSAVIGAILISALGANLIAGIQSSAVIPQTAKPLVTQAIAGQASNIEFGNTASIGNSNIPVNITNEITTISYQATVDASKTALDYGIIFILVAFVLSAWLPTGNASEVAASATAIDASDLGQKNSGLVSRQKVFVISAALIILVAAGASVIGYSIAKHKYQNAAAAATQQVSAQQISTQQVAATILPAQAGTSTGSLVTVATSNVAPVTEASTQVYANENMHFSVNIPSDWKVQNDDGEIVVTTPQNNMYSIQEYAIGTNDMNALQNFLASQPNLHDVTVTQMNGFQAFSFTVDGVFHQGYAFLNNSNLYYLLGTGVQNTPIAQTFKVI